MKAVIAGVLLMLAGCVQAAAPVAGGIYTDVRWGQETDGRLGDRQGRACAKSFLGLFATGDASIEAAALAGGVREITTVDRSSKNVLFLYAEYCTIAKGLGGDPRPQAARPPVGDRGSGGPPAAPSPSEGNGAEARPKVIPSYDPRTCRDGLGNLVEECWRAKGRN